MAEFINTVDVLGDDVLTDRIIERSITEYRDDGVTTIGFIAFGYCKQLTYVDLPSITYFGENVFLFDSSLVSVVLRNTECVPTAAGNIFALTPIASGTGYIYVPRDLVDSYKAATNWSTYANQFRALEDYTVDGTTTGELDPTKI